MDGNFLGVSSVGSPYMNIDPSYLINVDTEPQYLSIQPLSGPKRGRFELAFNQIGGSMCVGAGVGGMTGFFQGLRETKMAKITGAVRRTQLINFVVKKGGSSAQSIGTIALLYSAFGVALSKMRDADDEINTVCAGTATGLLYKSFGGARKCIRGGAAGLAISLVYCLITSREHVRSMTGL